MKKKKTPSNDSDLVTKGYLNETLDKRFDAFEVKIDLKLDSFKRGVENSIQKGIVRVLTRIDPILAEVENAKIDRDMSTEHMGEVKKKINNHEERTTKLENN